MKTSTTIHLATVRQAVWPVLLVTFLVLSPPVSAASATGIRLFVAPQGNDADPGTEQKPFATIGRAQRAVRALLAGTQPGGPITVLLRGGVYR